ETTQRILAARRMKTLSKLKDRTSGAKSTESACHLVTSTLRDSNDGDIPFSLVYVVANHNKSGETAILMSTTFDEGLESANDDHGEISELVFVKGKSTRKLPNFLLDTSEMINIIDGENNVNHETSGRQTLSTSIADANDFNTSSWPITQVQKSNTHSIVTLKNGTRAILFPVYTSSMGKMLLIAIIIFGLNQRRALDQGHLSFLQLVVCHVSRSLTHGRSREEERKQVEALRDLNNEKITFFRNINHKLRTPLTLILSPLEEIINNVSLDPSILSNLRMINRNACRLLEFVNNLQQFSQVDTSTLGSKFKEIDVIKCTHELTSNFESVAKLLKLDYSIQLPSHEELYGKLKNKVFLDKEMYEKILLNL
ncbi:17204_t:CDS:2, partial [Acaulospora morrowiae]